MEPDRMRTLVETARVARLATTGADGRPHLVPIAFALDGNVLVSAVDRKPKTTTRLARLRNVERDPNVTLLVDHYDDDWEALWWVRLRGVAHVVHEGPDRDRALELLCSKYAQYGEHPPPGPAIVVEIREWRGWDARPGA